MTHVQDVVNCVFYEDLSEITLVGYSYGGMVVTGCLDYIGDRVKHLVYLDAFVPGDGESLDSITGRLNEGEPRALPGQDWLRQPVPRSYDDPADAAFSEPRRSAQPGGTFSEAVRVSQPLEGRPFSLAYIKATGEPRPAENRGGAFWIAADEAKANPRWAYYEIETNHMVPYNKPRELADVLLEVTQ